MTTAPTSQRGLRLFAETLVAPSRGLAAAAARRSVVPALAVATAAGLLLAAAVAPRLDVEPLVEAQLARDPASAQLTPHDREVAREQAAKLAAVGAWAGGAVGPALRALGVALALFLAFRAVAVRAPFAPTLAVAAWGTLPLALRDLLTLPAALRAGAIAPDGVEGLLPSSLAALLPAGAPPQALAAAGAVDLFALWALALVALGMAGVAEVSGRRALAVTGVLWVAYVLVQRVALPGLAAGPAA